MELPTLGEHCSDPNCRRLDFLPTKCDCCKCFFCADHYTYSKHNCPKAFLKNVQIPTCPICNQLVPGKSDEPPDKRISRHIDTDCQSDKPSRKRKKVYSNRCSNKRCKQRELLPFTCDKCTLNYCIRHRLPEDHDCKPVVVINEASTGKPLIKGTTSTSIPLSKGDLPLRKGSMAAMSRTFNNFKTSISTALPKGIFSFGSSSNSVSGSNSDSISQPTPAKIRKIHGNFSEDAALAQIQSSLNESSNSSSIGTQSQPVTDNTSNLTQEQEDLSIAESERNRPTKSKNQNRNKLLKWASSSTNNCQIS